MEPVTWHMTPRMGETAVRLLSDYMAGKQIPARFTYSPDVVTRYNLDQFR